MTLPVTNPTLAKLKDINIEPHLVLCIEGLDYCFTNVTIKELIRYGMPDLFYGDPVVYGGVRPISTQKEYISGQGTSNSIKQQLQPDKGAVSSVSTMTIRMIDKNQDVTRLISPGFELPEPFGARATVYMGFGDTAFPEDYLIIHAGVISDIKAGAGWVELSINSPEEKKRQKIFAKTETKLNGALNAGVTTSLTHEPLTNDQGFLLPADALRTFVRIDDEIIEYTTAPTATSLGGLTRGQFTVSGGSPDTNHADEAEITSIYVLEGHPIDLALKIMLSDGPQYYSEDVPAVRFEQITGTLNIPNAVFLENVDIYRLNGVTRGDKVTITGAANGANNVTDAVIDSVVKTDLGSYLVLTGVSLVSEIGSSALVKFSSRYNVLGTGAGLGMIPVEVDIVQHEELRQGFLASAANVRIYLKEEVEGKELIEKELYLPFTGYSLPRSGKASMGAHLPPIPGSEIQFLDQDNIKAPSTIKIRRSFGKNFYNQIIYKYDELIVEERFVGGTISVDQDSIDEIGKKSSLVIEALGLRTDLQAGSSTLTSSQRFLLRYRRGAEYFEGIRVLFRVGARIEPGDIVSFDFEGLQVSNTRDGNRNKKTRLFEVINKSLDLKTGDVTLDLVDTNFDGNDRFGLFSPSSYIKSGLSTTQFVIGQSFTAPFGIDEFRKWEDIVGCAVKIRNSAYTLQSDSFVTSASSNTITVSPALSFVPSAGMLMEFAHYDLQTDRVKVIYTFMTDDGNQFPSDNGDPYTFA